MSMNWNDLLAKANANGGMSLTPPGTYPMRCEKAEATVSSNSNPMIKVKCRIVGGPYNDRVVWGQIVLSPDSPQWFFKKIAAFGVGQDFFAQNPSMAQTAAVLVNRTAMGTVENREWNGETRDGVNAFAPMGAAAATSPVPAPAVVPPTPAPVAAPPPQPQFIQPPPAPAPVAAPPPQPVAPPTQPQPQVVAPPAQPVYVPPAEPAPVYAPPPDQAPAPQVYEQPAPVVAPPPAPAPEPVQEPATIATRPPF